MVRPIIAYRNSPRIETLARGNAEKSRIDQIGLNQIDNLPNGTTKCIAHYDTSNATLSTRIVLL